MLPRGRTAAAERGARLFEQRSLRGVGFGRRCQRVKLAELLRGEGEPALELRFELVLDGQVHWNV
jgi:hypothetical protein